VKPEAVRVALPIIQRFEGYAKDLGNGKCAAYPDPAHGWKVPTIGWGCTGPDIKQGTVWPRAKCAERLEEEAAEKHAAVLRSSRALALDTQRAAAIVDFAFNLGVGQYQASTLRRAINAGDWMEASRQIRRWVNAGGRKLPGLVLRREVEALMLERGMR
jgi:lysozyme